MPYRTPPRDPGAVPIITRLAAKYRLDPRALLAVARGEGGLVNRGNDIGDKAGGGSYGPFQLYAQGELPKQFRGNPQAADAWAWSPAGIDYALSRMAQTGAAGLTGRQAVETIIRKFERPADPDKSVANALGRLGGGVPGGAAAAPAVPGAAVPPGPAPDIRRQFALALLQQRRSGTRDVGALAAIMQQQAPESAVTQGPPPADPPSPGGGSDSQSDPGGFVPEFSQRLGAMIAASGGRLKINSGYRSVAEQKKLFDAAVKKYGSVAAARKWVAPPGNSKHNHGLAADLAGDLAWAHKNAARFGLYFPMSYEPWHIELQGSRK